MYSEVIVSRSVRQCLNPNSESESLLLELSRNRQLTPRFHEQVVITSSFASIIDTSKGNSWDHTYSEADWNPITEEQALLNPSFGYQDIC